MSKQPLNDGGPAFPRPASTEYLDGPNETNCTHSDGMSLRDWFAGQALVGMASAFLEDHCSVESTPGATAIGQSAEEQGVDGWEVVVEAAYLLADTMLTKKGTT